MNTTQTIRTLLTAAGALLALTASLPALAESTILTTNTWTVIYDSNGKPLAGETGTLCYSAYFKSGAADKVCTPHPVTLDGGGSLSLTGQAKSWHGYDRPDHYDVSFEIRGHTFYGSVPIANTTMPDGKVTLKPAMWDPGCQDDITYYNDANGYPKNFANSSCSQAVHFEFHLPALGALASIESDSLSVKSAPAQNLFDQKRPARGHAPTAVGI